MQGDWSCVCIQGVAKGPYQTHERIHINPIEVFHQYIKREKKTKDVERDEERWDLEELDVRQKKEYVTFNAK